MTSIIRDLREIDIEINLQYRNSKLPKFIKKQIASIKRKKLHKLIDDIEDIEKIPIELLEEYCMIIYDTYPPYGRYRNCSKIIDNHNENIATFIIRIDDKRVAVTMINMSENLIENEERFVILRYTYIIEGKTKFSYGEQYRYSDFLIRDNDTINDVTRANLNDQKKIIKNICIDALHQDIVYFLKDLIERSERVYKI